MKDGKRVGAVYVEFGADTSKFDAGSKQVKATMQQTASTTAPMGDKLKAAFSGASKGIDQVAQGLTGFSAASLAGAGGVVLLAKGMSDATKAASDMNETVNKVDVVFGSSKDKVKAFGDTAASSMGMSKRSALEAAGTFGNLFTSMGMAKDQSASMSTELVKLAGDLASFNNIDPAEALEKLRSGLVGETEPLRTLGVNISEAAVQQKALQMGLGKTGEALTAAEKAQARYALILEQTQNAQGDFARTSDGLANQMRILKAEQEDLAASAGTAVLPAYLKLVQTLNSAMQAFSILTNGPKMLSQAFAGHRAELTKTTDSYHEYYQETLRMQASQQLLGTFMKQFGINLPLPEIGMMTQKEYEGAKAASEYGSDQREAAFAAKYAGDSAATAAPKVDTLKQSYSELQTIIAGGFGKEDKSYQKNLEEIQAQVDDTKNKLVKLGVPEFVAPENQKKIDDLTAKLRNVDTELYNLAKANKLDYKAITGSGDLDKMDIAGPMVEQIKALKGESYQYYKQIQDLGGVPYLTDDQRKDIDDARNKLYDLSQQEKTLAAEHEEAMKRMAFDMISKRAEQTGNELTETELNNLTLLGQKWGLYDEKTAAVINSINGNIGSLDTTKPQALFDAMDAVMKLPDSKTITVGFEVKGIEQGGADADIAESLTKNRAAVNDTKASGASAYDQLAKAQAGWTQAINDSNSALRNTSPMDAYAGALQRIVDKYALFTKSTQDATELVNAFIGRIESIPSSKSVVLRVIDTTTDQTYGSGGSGGGGSGNKSKSFASGGSFTIPPGYPNDSYYLGSGHWGQSGETVTVTPPGKSPGGINLTFGNVIISGVGDGKQAAQQFMNYLNRTVAASMRAGAGYAGG